MKYLILLGDGMAGYPLKELGGKTTLEYARTPNMDLMAAKGKLGLARTVPSGMPPGSDVANLSVLGYDPRKYYTGRAPLEAASIGVELAPGDVAFRCNLVTLKIDKEGDYCTNCVMEDFSAGHISSGEARELIKAVEERLGTHDIKFYPGVSYRHLMVWKGGQDRIACTPPHDITGEFIADKLPKGEGGKALIDLMKSSVELLEGHPVNRARAEAGKRPGNCIWLWGQGKKPALPPFKELYGLSGAMISAVDLMRGIAVILGLKIINVPGATGYIDTDYKGKAEAALKALKDVDFAYVHVEAPDEAGHGGNVEHKVKAIEDFDEKVVGTVMSALKDRKDCRVLVMPDHPTPIAVKSHTSDPVPFMIWQPGRDEEGSARGYSESSASGTRHYFDEGWKLLEYMLHGR